MRCSFESGWSVLLSVLLSTLNEEVAVRERRQPLVRVQEPLPREAAQKVQE